MKKILVLTSIFLTSISFAQVGVFVEKTSTEIGKSGDFKLTLVSNKNVKTAAVDNKILIEAKSLAETKSVELNKAGLLDLIATMQELKKEYMSKVLASNIEISSTNNAGFEVGASFVLDKPTTTTPVTKKEKYYVDTPEKYYEGKIVIRDGSGSYIWKDVTTTPVAKEQTGKWMPFIKLGLGSKSPTALTVEEFNAFLKFLEDNSSKL